MRQWWKAVWLVGVVALTGCTTTQRQARQESVVPLLEERIARLEERVVAMEVQQRQAEELDWRGIPGSDETDAEPLVIQPTATSARSATGGGAARFVKPSAKEIQQALKAAGYYHGSVDGKIGPKTRASIRQFQQDHGLVADGKVGRATWGALGKYLEG